MIKCKICKKTTMSNKPTGKYKLWAWITDFRGNKIGKRIVSEKTTCMGCNIEVLLE